MRMKRKRVDESFVPGVEEEAIRVEDLLAEPKTDHLSLDGVFSGANGFSCTNDHGLNSASGALSIVPMHGGEDGLNLGMLDGILDEVDEVDDLQNGDGLFGPCEDYLLDIDFPEVTKLDLVPYEGSNEANSCSESHSTGSSRNSCDEVGRRESSSAGLRESSSAVIPRAQCTNDMHDNTATSGPHDAFHNNCERLTLGSNKMQFCDSQIIEVLENNSYHVANGLCLLGSSSVQAIETSSLYRQKRTRKPPKRYIEESSFSKSWSSKLKQKETTTTRNDDRVKTGAHNDDYHYTRTKLSRRGRPKKQKMIKESMSDEDENYYDTESEDQHMIKERSKKTKHWRRNQRPWSLDEVMTLTDGIAQYGVGRWTEIKRALFLSSAYRTPMDIRDKWRNLLRVSCSLKETKKEVEVQKKGMLPKYVLDRVAELAEIHPYPRDSTKKPARSAPLIAPVHASKRPPSSAGGRRGRSKRRET